MVLKKAYERNIKQCSKTAIVHDDQEKRVKY
jgi:ribosomal protein L35